MVEMALLLPIFMILMLGITDVARAIFYYNVISNGAREGAREAILAYDQCQNTAPCWSPPSGSTVVGVDTAIVRAGAGTLSYSFLDSPGASSTPPTCTLSANRGCVWIFVVGGNRTTDCTPPNPASAGGTDTWSQCDFNANKQGGGNVVVEIEYQFQPLTPMLQNVLGGSTILWAKSEMKTEY